LTRINQLTVQAILGAEPQDDPEKSRYLFYLGELRGPNPTTGTAITIKRLDYPNGHKGFCDVIITNFFIEAYSSAFHIDGARVGTDRHKVVLSGGRCSTTSYTVVYNALGAKLTAGAVHWVYNNNYVDLQSGNMGDITVTGTLETTPQEARRD
jgi:hypothetical protein